MIRNAAILERERKEYERTTKLQEKELKELSDRKRRKQISIQIQILTGRKIVVYIDPLYDQLIDIKKKIQIKEGIHPDQMILFYNGVRLQENNTVSLEDVLHINHYTTNDGNRNGSSNNNNNICLFLTLRNRGG